MTPVACGVADRKEDRLVLAASGLESFIPPRVPPDGIVLVLQKVRAFFDSEAIALVVSRRMSLTGEWCFTAHIVLLKKRLSLPSYPRTEAFWKTGRTCRCTEDGEKKEDGTTRLAGQCKLARQVSPSFLPRQSENFPLRVTKMGAWVWIPASAGMTCNGRRPGESRDPERC